jgi:biotin carboxyl carrier protein
MELFVIPIPACTIVSTPVTGRLADHLAPDTPVRAGDVVARIEVAGRRHELRATSAGRVGGSMLRPSQPVAAGEPVVWLARRSAA